MVNYALVTSIFTNSKKNKKTIEILFFYINFKNFNLS
jgi:hypothetical protein